MGGKCSGGITIGDLDRLRAAPDRLRLCDLPRILELMAPKKVSSVGEVVERKPERRVEVEVGESMSGEAVPEEFDFCEPLVAVRRGGRGWKCES